MPSGWLGEVLELLAGPPFEERVRRAADWVAAEVDPERNPDMRTFAELLNWAGSPGGEIVSLAGTVGPTAATLRKLGIMTENIPKAGALPEKVANLVRKTQAFIEKRLLPLTERTKPLTEREKKRVEKIFTSLENRLKGIADVPVEIDKDVVLTDQGVPSRESLTGIMSFLQETLGVGSLLRGNPDVSRIVFGRHPAMGGLAAYNWITKELFYDPQRIGAGIARYAKGVTPLFREAGLNEQTSLAHELGHAAERGFLGDKYAESLIRREVPPKPDNLFAEDWANLIAETLRLPYATAIGPLPEWMIKGIIEDRSLLNNWGQNLFRRSMNAYQAAILGNAPEDLKNFFEHVQKIGIGAVPRGYFFSSPVEIPSELTAGVSAGIPQGQTEMTDRWLKMLAEQYGWIPGENLRGYIGE